MTAPLAGALDSRSGRAELRSPKCKVSSMPLSFPQCELQEALSGSPRTPSPRTNASTLARGRRQPECSPPPAPKRCEKALPASPRTPSPHTPARGRRQSAFSPPPAPKPQRKVFWPLVLARNDVVEVVEILAKLPDPTMFTTIPIPGDGRTPLQFAVDSGCDQVIIDILADHEAELARRGDARMQIW